MRRLVLAAFLGAIPAVGWGQGTTIILETAAGDGSISIPIDGYGSFGQHPLSTLMTGPQFVLFDLVGEGGLGNTTFESAVYFRVRYGGNTSGTFLSTGPMTYANRNPMPDVPFLTATATQATSGFDLPHEVRGTLTQYVEDVGDGPSRIGSLLVQEYTFTNHSADPVSLDVIRWFDGDLSPSGGSNADDDGGGRAVIGSDEFLFDTVDPVGMNDESQMVVAISACGGTPVASGRFDVGEYQVSSNAAAVDHLLDNDDPLRDAVVGDGADSDQLVDVGSPKDLVLAFDNTFDLPAGATVTYTTTTLFGRMSLAEASHGCESLIVVPEPDADGDGVPDDEDACPGHDDTPEPDEDLDDDGVNDACDACPTSEARCVALGTSPTTACRMSGGPSMTPCLVEHADGPDLALVYEGSCVGCSGPVGWVGVRLRVENRGRRSPDAWLATFGSGAISARQVPSLGPGETWVQDVSVSGTGATIVIGWDGGSWPSSVIREDPDRGNNILVVKPFAEELPDGDDDGQTDLCDSCPTAPSGPEANDDDLDGVPDLCDTCLEGDDRVDFDADRVADYCDPCPFLRGTPLGHECRVGGYEVDRRCEDSPPLRPVVRRRADACPTYNLEIQEVLPCRRCSNANGAELGWMFVVANSGNEPSPATSLRVFGSDPQFNRSEPVGEVPALEPGAAMLLGPTFQPGWFVTTDLALARVGFDSSGNLEAAADCYLGDNDVRVSPPENPVCLPAGDIGCYSDPGDTGGESGVAAALLLAVPFLRRRRAA